ncbi:MAG: ATP-dependent Clp protease proteolytic subunit [Kiritimatiellae bacterium]|nr:ATP-dependent Clp protease proteolytic subunit [Kiritimatiellia bacterium]
MPNWGQVLKEMAATTQPLDAVRRRYLASLAEKRGRNVIAYYSGWLQKPGLYQTSINDDDKNGFMAVIHGLDREKGLDLILHTPGGDMAATESLIDYLHRMFNGDVVAVIPQIAMSAGTMIACSCRKIIMGKQSNIGPIDPQLNGVPAYGVIKEFEDAIEEIQKKPSALPVWQMIIGKYHPTFLGECRKAINLSNEIVRTRLETVMFAGDVSASSKAQRVVDFLNEHENTKIHARHIDIEKAVTCGLKIKRLEDDNDLQDAVLTVHHCYMHTFANSQAIKITENQKGNAVVNVARK